MYDIRFVAPAFSVVVRPEVLKLHIKSLQHHLIINSPVNHTSGGKHYILLLKQKSYEGQVNGNNCRVSRLLFFFFLREMFEQITSVVAVTAADERAAATTQPCFTLLSPSLLVPIKPYFSPHPKSVVYPIVRSFIGELIVCQLEEGEDDEGGGDISGFLFFLPVRQIYMLRTQQLDGTELKGAFP